ncbi:MAG TPA: hypothetical protein V6D08_12140 [Candidatus Obscuribacterales bacterium]
MFHQSVLLALCIGAITGWATIFLTRGFWVRKIQDAQERNAMRKLAPVGGLLTGLLISMVVLLHPSIEQKNLLVPITALGTLGFFVVGAMYLALFERLERWAGKSNRKY